MTLTTISNRQNVTLAIVAVVIAIASFAAIMHICACGREKNTFVRIKAKGEFPSADDIVEYYNRCREDRISEAAFICATDIYWDFYFEGMKRYFSSNSVPVDETVLMHEVENVAKKDFENICYLAKKKYSEFFWLIREINNSRTPDDKQMALADLDVALHDARHNCRFVESALARYNDILDSDEVFEHLLPLLTPYDRSCIIKIHKIIFKDWKSL